MFGGRNGVSAGCVQHDDAAPRRRFDIDIVHADAGAADHAQFRSGIQDTGGHFGLAAHDQSAELGDKIDKFRFAQAGFDRDLERAVARKFLDSALGNGIGDEDFG